MATATTADFFGQGGDIANPFSSVAAPQGAPQQATGADELAARATSDPNSGVNQANSAFYQSQAAYDPSKGPQDMNAWDAAFYKGPNGEYINRYTGETMAQVQKRISDDQYGGFLTNAAKTVAQHPWLLTLPAAPFAVASLGSAVTGTSATDLLGLGGDAAESAAGGAAASSPAITTGGATEVPTLAAPAAAGAAAPAAAGAASPWLTGLATGAGGAAINLAGHLAVDAIAGGKTGADKALIAKQDQLASEAAARRDQGSQAAMDMMAQRMLAFAPMNNYLAMIGGQGNALSPQTVAGMVANPYPPQLDPSLQNYQGNDPSKIQEIQSYQQRMAQYQAAESARSQAIQQGFPPPPPQAGTPMMPPPMAPKKYF